MERTARIRWVTFVLLLAVLGTFVAGAAGCATPEDTERIVKVGVHTSLTGGLADIGSSVVVALELAAEELSGFEVDGVAYDIELIVLDDAGDPSLAPVVAQGLIDEGVVGVIGALTSGSTNAALPLYESEEVPLISGSATMAEITEAGFVNFFRTCLRDDLQGQALAEWAFELGTRRAVVMDDESDYAAGLATTVGTKLDEMGVEVLRQVGEIGDADFAADFSEQIETIGAFGPDTVIFTGYHREAGVLRAQLLEAGLGDIRFMGGDGIKSDEIATSAGGAEYVQGLLCTFGGLSTEQMPGYAQFASDFEAVSGEAPGPYAENNYDALGALVRAIVDSQSFEGADLIDALHNVEFTGVMGPIGFDDKGDLRTPEGAGTELVPRFRFEGESWVLHE